MTNYQKLVLRALALLLKGFITRISTECVQSLIDEINQELHGKNPNA